MGPGGMMPRQSGDTFAEILGMLFAESVEDRA
jgi:hypothetical protein